MKTKPLLIALTLLAGASIVIADSLTGQAAASTTPANNSLVGIQEQISGTFVWRKWSLTALKTYLNAQLNFVTKGGNAPTGTVWNGNTIGVTYGGTGGNTAALGRAGLGLTIGTNVQAWSANLDTLSTTTGFSLSDTAGIGYLAGTGIGSNVIQSSSRSTGVTINTVTGSITMNAASLAIAGTTGDTATFTVTNSKVSSPDTIVLSLRTTSTGLPHVWVKSVTNGSFNISIKNESLTTADTTADVINLAIIKGSST